MTVSEAELKNLTVPQLKALCKEKKLVGYSKLAKPIFALATTTHAKNRIDVVSSAASARPAPAVRIPAVPQQPSVSQPNRKNISDKFLTTSTSSTSSQLVSTFRVPAVPQQPDSESTSVDSNSVSTGPPAKKRKTTPAKASTPSAPNARDDLAPRASLTPAASSEPPPLKKRKVVPSPTHSTPAPNTAYKAPPAQKRFVPLVIQKPLSAKVTPTPSSPPAAILPLHADNKMLCHLDFPTPLPPASLSAITLPPSVSQRKRVPRYALLLSQVADEDLRNCVLVSRMFRYAGKSHHHTFIFYLSAFHRLSADFAGQRLSTVLLRYSKAMTNMWPYLEQRMQEKASREQLYKSSFLNRLFPIADNVISQRLWSSPDHEKQIVIALRFLLTRLFFQVSVGDGKGGRGWMAGQIVGVKQLVQDEVWIITVQHDSPASTESFYVLESTCEPLTAVADSTSTGLPVHSRSDWSEYIAQRQLPPLIDSAPRPSLMDHLSWTNHEEYERGISRVWLRRIAGEGEIGDFKRVVAERYILACVVGNSLSGRWMSSTQMCQDFAGIPEAAPARIKSAAKVNLFLPGHHHVESIHFTASGCAGVPLHAALAVVQTPGREYFIFRDNGMQVGCEEDGVAEVWMKILHCDSSGVALRSM
ncbi:hypothetical protein C8J57DRAFT_1166183 [Mycena rebaudengoi]|nr:hypothetical protein C8J57DRAFT_1166183 [Mycena rebaudengoi]